jgi:hypothetical protein
MDSDSKLALAVLLLVGGAIWLFFCVIWMPPLTTALIYLVILLRIPTDVLPSMIIRYEFVLPMCSIAFGLYIALKRKVDQLATRTKP